MAMKIKLILPLLALAIVLASCAKEREDFRRPIVEIHGRMCAIEITEGSRVTHDTIIGHKVYGGGLTVDTLTGTALYNLALKEGEWLAVRVTHLRTPATDGEACIIVRGDRPTGRVCGMDSIVAISL